MYLAPLSIEQLSRILNGDTKVMPYLSGPELVWFFNEHGSRDVYGQGFPSRWIYVRDKLKSLNEDAALGKVLADLLDPRRFVGTEFDYETAVSGVNEILQYDGYKVVRITGGSRIVDLQGGQVVPDTLERIAGNYVLEQIDKCDTKIAAGDYDGAITNARTLAETVIVDILSEKDPDYQHKGDLTVAYKRLKALLNLDPASDQYPDSVKQILSGLNSVVVGISTLRNEMSDAHRRRHPPDRHHARLAVNASKTLSDFVLDSFVKQNRPEG